MKRAENCIWAQINHTNFQDDALVFQFAKSKGHRMGEEHMGPWHVYSNPDESQVFMFGTKYGSLLVLFS